MKIAIIGASGKSGRRLVDEALRQGHEVTAIIRDKNTLTDKNIPILERDLFSLTPDDVSGFDAVINAFNAPAGREELHQSSLEHLIKVFEKTPHVRLIVVGGAGSLYTDKQKNMRLVESKNFPAAYFPAASNMAAAFAKLQGSNANWTYLSPAAMYDPTGKRTGSYTLGDDVLIANKSGESYVSYADYAIAMIDELKNKNHVRKRFTVVSEKK